MKFTKQAEYAVMLLERLAESAEPVSLSKAAKEGNLSYAMLRKVAHLLQKQGLVSGFEGFAGGYRLALPAGEINLTMVLESVGEELYSYPCCEGDKCDCSRETAVCPKNSVLNNVGLLLAHVYGEITLNDLIGKKISCNKIYCNSKGEKDGKCKI